MPGAEFILPHAIPFVIALARIAGLFLAAPALSGVNVPVRFKALLALLTTLSLYPTLLVDAPMYGALTMPELPLLMVTETMVGYALGLIATLPVYGLQMGGLLMGQQMGLGIASIFNPALNNEGDVVGQILLFLGMALFVTLDGLEILHLGLRESFETAPLGALTLSDAPMQTFVDVLSGGSELAVRVAAPVTCVLLVESIATGFVMKTVPQLNVLSFGFPLKILMGIVTLIGSMTIIGHATHVELESAMAAVFQWIHSLGAGG